MARSLDVYLHHDLVGHLIQDDDGDLSFEYGASWLEEPAAMSLSRSLPLRKERFRRKECHAFFGGILPEEGKRERIARNLGISARNDFAMLERIGGVQFGIDLSPFILRKARIRLGARASLVRSDAMALPFRDGAFDRVYCSEVLEHVLDPESVIREMHRVLAPGGIAVISVPNEVLINRIKRIVFGLPLGSRLVAGEYRVSKAMDEEWHLHAFGHARLEQALAGRFGIETLVGVPSRLMPLRLVARLSSPACAKTAV